MNYLVFGRGFLKYLGEWSNICNQNGKEVRISFIILTQPYVEKAANQENIKDRSRINKTPFWTKNSSLKYFLAL